MHMALSLLIVEDDLTFSTMLKTWLRKKGFEVEAASTQARARKLLSARDFDLVLSDLRLPDKEIAERLKNFKPLEKPVDGYLKRYRAQVTSASKGAVLGSQK